MVLSGRGWPSDEGFPGVGQTPTALGAICPFGLVFHWRRPATSLPRPITRTMSLAMHSLAILTHSALPISSVCSFHPKPPRVGYLWGVVWC